MVQVETTEIELVGLPFPTVLTHDHPWHRFQDFTRAHDRTRVELRTGHGSHTRGSRNPDKILAWIIEVGEIPKRPRTGNDHIGGHAYAELRINRDLISPNVDITTHRQKVHHSEREDGRTQRGVVKAVYPHRISDGVFFTTRR